MASQWRAAQQGHVGPSGRVSPGGLTQEPWRPGQTRRNEVLGEKDKASWARVHTTAHGPMPEKKKTAPYTCVIACLLDRSDPCISLALALGQLVN